MAQGPNRDSSSLRGCLGLPVPEVGSVLWVAYTAKGFRHCRWESAAAPAPDFCAGLREPQEVPAFVDGLRAYLSGADTEPASLPIDPVGTPFQLRVWTALRAVPRGQVRTYAGIALDIGSPRAMRAVGQANGRNPLAVVVPCHRIVAAGNALGGYSGGLERKRFLLGLEGVPLQEERVSPGQMSLL